MKSIKNETLLAAAIVAVVIAGTVFGYSTYKDKENQEIFASKVITLNKIHNQYEISNVTGYKNCIKLNSEAACIKRMESISKHFANEYNSKLLKIVADEYGIDVIENDASGRQTAIGKKKTTADVIAGVFFASLNVFKFDKLDYLAGKYSIDFNNFDSRIPTLAEAYGMNQIKIGQDLISAHELNSKLNKYAKDFDENKDEVVSISSKFAELGLEAQNEQFKEFDTQDLLRLMELEEAKDSGGSDSAIGKAPALMDTLVKSIEGAITAPENDLWVFFSGCHGEELKGDYCKGEIERRGMKTK